MDRGPASAIGWLFDRQQGVPDRLIPRWLFLRALVAIYFSAFFAPPGFRPGLGQLYPVSRASLFLLQWEWFRIYFESGVVKLLSGDPEWRHFRAMDEYYQNGPLPTWVGWYVQHLPHGFHAGTVYAALALELGLVCMLFLPRRWRTVCFFIVTPWQVGVILTANYTFLNYLVLAMGVLMLDDRFVLGAMPEKWRVRLTAAISRPETPLTPELTTWKEKSGRYWRLLKLSSSAVMLTWIFYVTMAELLWMFAKLPLPTSPVAALETFRIANRYGLFAVMTRGRYEIEFQGSADGQTWIAYPFRYKPQKLNQPPRIYAPYQPRFNWT